MSERKYSNDSKVSLKLASETNQNHTSDVDSVLQEKSIGVVKAEILAQQWTPWYYKVILLISAFVCGYAYGLDSQVRYIFNTTATNSYSSHSLLTTVSVITSIAAAVCQPIYARLSDVFGRLEIFIVAVVFYIVGTVIESQAYDVQRYAAGSVFYQIGYSGVVLVLLLMMSDFSSLRWRLYYSFVPAYPFIINTWISGDVKSAVGSNWSWGIGMWAFIFPLACIPLLCCMLHMRWKAGKTQEWAEFKQRQTKYQELGLVKFLVYLFWTLDIIGVVLLAVALGCLLGPLTLAGGVKSTWQDGNIIAPLVIGFVLFFVFVFWESKTKHAIAPVHLLGNRGIWAGLYICFSYNLIFGIESSYLYSVLRIAVNESDKSATRISSLSSFVSTIGGFIFGLTVVYFKRLKFFMIFGISMWMVALGILLHFRSGLDAHAGIIGGMCLLGFGMTFFTYPVIVSIQACVSHEHMAVMTSLAYTIYRIGSAVGSAVSGAIWTQKLYKKILEHMSDTELATSAYQEPLTFIVTYTWETPERQALAQAYRELQFLLILVALCLCVPMIFCSLLLRDVPLGREQSIEDIEKKQQEEPFSASFKHLFNFNPKSTRTTKEVV